MMHKALMTMMVAAVVMMGTITFSSSAWAESMIVPDISTACACDDDCTTVFGPNAKCNNGVCSQSGPGTPCVQPDGGPSPDTAPPSPDTGPQGDVGATKLDAGPTTVDSGGWVSPDGFCGCEAGVTPNSDDDSGGCALSGSGASGASLSIALLLLGLALRRR